MPFFSAALSPAPLVSSFSSSVICAPHLWLDAAEFSALAGMPVHQTHQVLEQSASGQSWRNTLLQVRVIQGQCGQTGRRYQVRADSLPTKLYQAWFNQHTPPTPTASAFSNVLPLVDGPHPLGRQAPKHRNWRCGNGS